MSSIWEDYQQNWGPDISAAIQAGLDKLDVYRERAELVPAYVISMSEFHLILFYNKLPILCSLESLNEAPTRSQQQA